MKFGRSMQNQASLIIRSKSKPEVELKFCFLESKAVTHRLQTVIRTKFGLQTYFVLLKRVTSLKPKPEAELLRHGRHLDKSLCCHNFMHAQ